MRFARIVATVTFLSAVVIGLPTTASHAAPSDRWPAPHSPERAHPKLAPALEQQAEGRRPAAATTETAAPDAAGRIVVQVSGPNLDGVRTAVQKVGGEVRTVAATSVLAWVEPSALNVLADDTHVDRVGVPRQPTPSATTQGVGTTGASTWQAGGLDGTGVKVAIVDLGFSGLAGEQLAGRMPVTVTTEGSHCTNGINGATNHGVAVAEIVHQMAPNAQLFLVCITFDADVAFAEQYLAGQGVSVVNASFSDNLGGRGDGSGPMGDAITAGRNAGQLWSVAAGNNGDAHFSFTANDFDHDGGVEFAPGGSLNPSGPDSQELFTFNTNGTIKIQMKWDAWPITNQEFDICLWAAGAPLGAFQGCQTAGQNSSPDSPVSGYDATVVPGTYVFAIFHPSGTTIAPRIDLYFEGGETNLQRVSAVSSMGEPATSPAAMAVGAAFWGNGVLEPFSSQGPTIDGRLKPDLVGPDGVSNDIFNPFYGTSASAPHATGAAALVKQALPNLTAGQVQTVLECRATDAGAGGPDNVYGYGKLALGPVADPVAFAKFMKPAVVRGNTIFERTGLCTGVADTVLSYGGPGDVVLLCDWDGDGTRTPGVYRNGLWLLRNAPGNGPADVAGFSLGGNPGDIPVCGHWSGAGNVETPGVYRGNRFFLRFSNTSGVADANFVYGDVGDTPVSGDWDGDGITTVGVFRSPGVWFLRNTNTTGVADQAPVRYGDPGDLPVPGDWDGNGTTTLGILRGGFWFVRNAIGGGVADLPPFVLGGPGDRPQAWR